MDNHRAGRQSNQDAERSSRATKIAFTAPTSNSGFKRAVGVALKSEFNRSRSQATYEPVFSGKHDNSVASALVNKDYEAAAVASEVMFQPDARRARCWTTAKIRTRSTSPETFPTTGYGTVYNLDPKLVAERQESVLRIPLGGSRRWRPNSREGQSSSRSSTEGDWGRAAKIDEATGAQIHLQSRQVTVSGARRMLRIQGLVKRYRTGDLALKGLDLEVPDGQVMALIGPSGAGKVDRHPLHQPAGRADRRTSAMLNDAELTQRSAGWLAPRARRHRA